MRRRRLRFQVILFFVTTVKTRIFSQSGKNFIRYGSGIASHVVQGIFFIKQNCHIADLHVLQAGYVDNQIIHGNTPQHSSFAAFAAINKINLSDIGK